jgi:hypothetical protein
MGSEMFLLVNYWNIFTGKSSLTVRFVEGVFVEIYYPTIENTLNCIIKYKGQDFATEIVDTAGQDEYSILNSKHFIGIHGYMIVYSVASRRSFDMVRVIRDKILHHLVRKPQSRFKPEPSYYGIYPRADLSSVFLGSGLGSPGCRWK